MKKLIWLGLIVVLMLSIGCAHGRTTYYPAPKCDSGCADVTVVRKAAIIGGASSVAVQVNGFPIAYINTNEYIKFRLPVGLNAIGLEMHGNQLGSISIPFDVGKEYYFLIDTSAAMMTIYIRRAEKEEVEKYLSDPLYKELDQNKKADAKEWR